MLSHLKRFDTEMVVSYTATVCFEAQCHWKPIKIILIHSVYKDFNIWLLWRLFFT